MKSMSFEKLYQHHIDARENLNHEASLSSWKAWNITKKLSKNNLLNDFNDIDPIVQRHMTLSSATSRVVMKKDAERKQYHRQRHDVKCAVTANRMQKTYRMHPTYRHLKQERFPLPSAFNFTARHVAKSRRLMNNSSDIMMSFSGSFDMDNQRIFWKNLRAITGNIHTNAQNLTH
jgi:hypothetical protein